jgi:biopolymer transport protein ExbD
MNFSSDNIAEEDSLQIDLTSLIDVVFLLLIFFMVSTTFVQSDAMNVQLPKASASKVTAQKDKQLTVDIDKDGLIFYEGKKTTKDQLRDSLLVIKNKTDNPILIVRADKATNHGTVVSVMDLARSSGIEKLAIATEQE